METLKPCLRPGVALVRFGRHICYAHCRGGEKVMPAAETKTGLTLWRAFNNKLAPGLDSLHMYQVALGLPLLTSRRALYSACRPLHGQAHMVHLWPWGYKLKEINLLTNC